MVASIAATPDAVNKPPRVALTVTGLTGTAITVTRVDSAGNRIAVRSANPGALASGGWVGFDYEAPYGQVVTYVATSDTDSVGASTTATLSVTQPWLIHPGIPSLSVPLTVTAPPTRTRATSSGVFRVLGRAEAVVVSSGQRQASTFDLSVRVDTETAEDALLALLDDDSVMLLQVVYPGLSRSLYEWVSVGDVQGSALVGWWGDDRYVWALPCTVAARPSGLLQAQRTWADVVAQNATWSTVVGKYATWRDLIVDNQSTYTPAVVTSLPTITVTDNGDGTVTWDDGGTGALTDNGDGTFSINTTGSNVTAVDNGDGTVTYTV